MMNESAIKLVEYIVYGFISIIGAAFLFFLYCCCRLSGMRDEQEYKMEIQELNNINNTSKN